MLLNCRRVLESEYFLGFSSRLDLSVNLNIKAGIAPDFFGLFVWAV